MNIFPQKITKRTKILAFAYFVAFCLVSSVAAQSSVTLDQNQKVRNSLVKFGIGNTVDFTGATVIGLSSGGAGLVDADYGDITVSGTGTVMTIDNGVVSLAKMANMATASFLGRSTAGTGSPEVLSVSAAKTLLNLSGTNTGDQIVPANTTATSNQFFSAYNSTTGVFTKTQPLFTGLNFTSSNLTSIATRNFSDLQFSGAAGKVNYSSGLLSLLGTDGNSQFTAVLNNGTNTDNSILFSGVNGNVTSFQVNGRGALTLGDDDQGSGFYQLNFNPPSLTASRTLSWADETGTIAVNRFNVKTYGAKGDGVTDDTAAIQAAINAIPANKGGTVYFPNGVYIIAGALQDTSGANSQLTLPSVSAPGGEQYTVRLLGETPPSQIPWYLGGGHTPNTGVVIKSTLSSGNGALLGGYGPVGSNHNFTNITVVVENLNFRMVANPTNSCLNFFYVNSAVLRKVMVDAGNWIGSTISQPTTASSYGIKMPQNNNGGNNYLDQIQVIGFYTDILTGEHTIGGQIELYSANVGMEFAFAYHTSQYARLLYANCVRGLKWTGIHFVDVNKLDVEHTDLAVWYATTYDVDDGNNYGHGRVNYHIVLANSGVTNVLLKNGGNSIVTNTLAQQSINLVTNSNAYYPGISIVATPPAAAVIDFTKIHDPTAVDYGGDADFYSDGSYLVFNSKTGANPLYLNFDNNNAGATVNMFAGNFVVSQAGTLTAGTVPVARIGSLGTGVAASLAIANNSAGGYSPIDGTATLSNKTLASPKITTGLFDPNGNLWLGQTATASAIFGLDLTNAASGGTVIARSTTPTQAAAGIAGTPLRVGGSDATAGSSTAGAVAGGSVNVIAGDAKRLTSGNAVGGDVTLTAGRSIGTGNEGNVFFNTAGAVRGGVGYDGHSYITSGRRFYLGGDPTQSNRGGYFYNSTNGTMFGTNGTTDAWSLTSSGHFQPQTDVTYDEGDSTHRVRIGYFGNGTTGGLIIGGGTQLKKIISATATLDFGSTAAGASSDLTITVTGAALGDVVSIGVPDGSTVANSSYSAWVSAADTVKVRFIDNALVGTADPASGTFRAAVSQF